MVEGALERRRDWGRMCGGCCPIALGVEWSDKKRDMGGALAIDGHQSNILHTTTNQKQVATMEGSMEGRCDKWEVRGKHDTIVSGGALELIEVKN